MVSSRTYLKSPFVVALTGLMVHFGAICCLICLSASAPNDLKEYGQTDYSGHRVYRLHLASEKAAHWLMKFQDISGVEFWDEPVQEEGTWWTADLMVAPNIVFDVEDVFRKANFSFEVIIEDVQVAGCLDLITRYYS